MTAAIMAAVILAGCGGRGRPLPPVISTRPPAYHVVVRPVAESSFVEVEVRVPSGTRELRLRQKGEEVWKFIFHSPPSELVLSFPVDPGKERILVVWVDGETKELKF